MGLNQRHFLAASAAILFAGSVLNAAPRLRLVSSTVGPVSIAQGTNGAAQTVEIYNDARRFTVSEALVFGDLDRDLGGRATRLLDARRGSVLPSRSR